METLKNDMKSIQAANSSQLNELARSAIPLNKGVLVLVGDKKTILKELAELQPDGPAEEGSVKFVIPAPVEVDSLGNRIGS